MASTSSTSTYSYLSTANNRFSGLASGMDIDSIVEKLMKAESAKMEKLQQQKQKYEWQRDAYRSVNTKLETFRTEAFDKYGKQSDFVVNKVSNSNDSKVSAVATSAASGTLTISAAKMATSASKVGTPTLANASKNTTVSELLSNSDKSGTIKIDVIQKDGSTKTVEFDYKATDTLEDLANKINNEKKGLTAMVGENGQFSLTADAVGKKTDGTVRLANADSNGLFNALGFGSGTELANGTDATYTINGVTKTSDKNSFSVSGYNVELKSNFGYSTKPADPNVSTSVEDPFYVANNSDSVTISSTLDTDSIVDKVKSFIDTYNTLIKDLKGQTSEKKNYSYAPLTDAQKSEMSEDQIKKWEEQSKKGLLRGDKSIESALSKMRSAISSASVELDTINPNTNKPDILSIFSLGIDTDKNGELTIKDETKLREQIEKNPQAVADLFTQSESASTNGKGGIIVGVRSAAKSAVDTILTKAGKEGSLENAYNLGKSLTSIEKQIEDWKDRLKDIEDRYYKQFTAMETAIQNANTQSSIFTS